MITRLRQLENPLVARPLPEVPGRPRSSHILDQDSIDAVDAALACDRPLLVRGEPGTGKSQLARAVAAALGRAFVSVHVDSRTEARELLWRHDAVTRLADAQVLGAVPPPKGSDVGELLAQSNYVEPGPVWWALNWSSAREHIDRPGARLQLEPPGGQEQSEAGVVLLIDEIDKADTSVPNGLLEVLGQGTFSVPGRPKPVCAGEPSPLVVITTNEDRALPDAFIRRCIVLHMRVPDGDRETFVSWLIERAWGHCEVWKRAGLYAKVEAEAMELVLRRTAEQLAGDRGRVKAEGFCPPGLAEYLDLVRAVLDGGVEQGEAALRARIEALSHFVFHKHRDAKAPGQGSW